MAKVIIGVIVGLIVLIGVFLTIDPNQQVPTTNNETNTSLVERSKISVKILGAVVSPGTYSMEPDETLSDLIDKAGGVVSSADQDCYDSSIVLDGHDSFYIPFVSGFSQECVVSDVEKVNINTASAEELAKINGLSSTIASNIVAYREVNGDFKCLEDLTKVSGIGTKTFEKIRDYITLK